MSGDALLGIDLGTTVLKAALFDGQTGRTLAEASVRLPLRAAADGTREQDLPAVDRALRVTIGRLRRAAAGRWARIGGVGLSAQGGSAIIVDRATGRAQTPMQLWSDTRPLKHLAAIAARKPASYWPRLSYLAQPGPGLGRMVWLRERVGRLFHDGNLYVGAGEYLFFRLTGLWRQDAGSCLQIGCYDARRHRLAAEPLRLIGIPGDFVAPLRRGHETRPLSNQGARLLGLEAGVPVAGPYLDHEAGFLAATGVSRRPLQCSLGTAWVGNFVRRSRLPSRLPPRLPSRLPPPPPGVNLVLPSPLGSGDLVVRVMLAGNASWEWAVSTFTGAGSATGLARAEAIFARDLLPPSGLVALPWLTRPNHLAPEFLGGGAFLGLNAHTTGADLLRAMAAGMCFEFAHVFEPVRRSRAVDSVVLTGGASGGWHFRQILAALFSPLPVFHMEDELAGVRGALYAFKSASSASRARRVRPPAGRLRSRILEQYDLYCRTCQALSSGVAAGQSIVLDSFRNRSPR